MLTFLYGSSIYMFMLTECCQTGGINITWEQERSRTIIAVVSYKIHLTTAIAQASIVGQVGVSSHMNT